MGFQDKILLKLEEKNNSRILENLRELLPSSITISLTKAKCAETNFEHSALEIVMDEEPAVFHRCRQMWYMEAAGLPRMPLPLLDPIDSHLASTQIAAVLLQDFND